MTTAYDNYLIKIFVCVIGLICVFFLVFLDSKFHFDKNLIELKKTVNSAQRHWNVFFGQGHVYESGGLKHLEDFRKLEGIIEPNTAVFADIATSYYMASSLPVYVRNVNRHHGRYKSYEWGSLLSSNIACYIDVPNNLKHFKEFLSYEETRASAKKIAPIRYLIINVDVYNVNFKYDCLSQTRRAMLEVVDSFAKLVYEGKTLQVYRLRTAPVYSY